MLSAQILKEELQQELEYLSIQNLQELLSFVRYLKFKELNQEIATLKPDLDPKDDPILQLIGMADAPPLANDIDEILYGSAPRT